MQELCIISLSAPLSRFLRGYALLPQRSRLWIPLVLNDSFILLICLSILGTDRWKCPFWYLVLI